MEPLVLLKGEDKPLAGRKWERILLIQLAYIGDVVVTMPLIRALRENCQDSRIVVCTREHSRQLIEDCPWADAALPVRGGKSAAGAFRHDRDFFRDLRRARFDLAIDVRTGTRGAIIARLSGAPCRVRPSSPKTRFYDRFFTHLVALPGPSFRHHASRYYLGFASLLGLRVEDELPRLVVPPARQEKALAILREAKVPPDRPFVAFHPFSSQKHKEWQPERCAELADRVRARYGVPVVLTGGPADRGPSEAIAGLCRTPTCNLAGKTSIGELAALLQRSAFLIAVDTAAVHIAAAVGVPTLTLYGPSDPLRFKPPGEEHTVVSKGLPCVPCDMQGCENQGTSRCLLELSVEEVWAELEPRLNRCLSAFFCNAGADVASLSDE